jgi:hypothetical protein
MAKHKAPGGVARRLSLAVKQRLFRVSMGPMDIAPAISGLVDGWCQRRALHPLRILLPFWPPMNGFTDEWHQVWAALRHVRAMCREELVHHGEAESVNAVVAGLSRQLFPSQSPQDIEQLADRLTAAIFGAQSS